MRSSLCVFRDAVFKLEYNSMWFVINIEIEHDSGGYLLELNSAIGAVSNKLHAKTLTF